MSAAVTALLIKGCGAAACVAGAAATDGGVVAGEVLDPAGVAVVAVVPLVSALAVDGVLLADAAVLPLPLVAAVVFSAVAVDGVVGGLAVLGALAALVSAVLLLGVSTGLRVTPAGSFFCNTSGRY